MTLTGAAFLVIISNVLKIYKDAKDVLPDISKLHKGLVTVDPKLSKDLEEYLIRTYEYVSKVGSFAYQGYRPIRSSIIEPTLMSKERRPYTLVNMVQFEAIPDKKIVLMDSAGMGKSTALKFLTTTLIDSQEYFPIFLEARKIKTANGLTETLSETVFQSKQRIGDIEQLLSKYGTCLIIDGIDEIPLSIKNDVVADIARLSQSNEETRVIISSRPDDANRPLNFLPIYYVKPLSFAESIKMIKMFDDDGSNSRLLIGKMEENNSIKEFMGNPLMVSLLFRAFDYRQTIPIKKPTFYRQVYDSLFLDHDIKKGDAFIREKNSKLEIDDFHKAVRALGYITFIKGEIEYTKDGILQMIEDSRKRCPELSFTATELLSDLCSTVPMIIKDGEAYRWSHKSLQEYFAAQHVCTDLGSNTRKFFEALAAKQDASYYRNFIDIIYDANYNIFEEYYLSIIIKKIISDFQTSMSHADRPKGLSDELASDRLELTLYKELYMVEFDYSRAYKSDGIYDEDYLEEFFTSLHNDYSHYGGTSIYVINELVTVLSVNRDETWTMDFLAGKRNRIIRFSGDSDVTDTPVYASSPVKKRTHLKPYNRVSPNYLKNYETTNIFLRKTIDYSIDISMCKTVLRELDERGRMLVEMI